MIYALLQILIRLFLGTFLRIEVEGRANVPEGGFLVVSNHLSWSDTLFIMYALPRKPWLHTLANQSTVFDTRLKRWLMPRVGVLPIRRNRGMLDEDAVNDVYRLLEAGERLIIFPEGAYGSDGRLRPLKDGVGYFAINSGKPLLPISLAGTNRLRPFSRVRVIIGRPFIPDPPMIWTVKRRVAAVVSGVRTALSRLGRRSNTRRGGFRRFWRSVRWRRGAHSRSTWAEAAQVTGVERAEAVVEGQQTKD